MEAKIALIIFLLGLQVGQWLTVYGIVRLVMASLRSSKNATSVDIGNPALPG
jgi:hypothetical protein